MKKPFFILALLLYGFFGYSQGNFPFIQEEKIWADIDKMLLFPGYLITTDYYKFEGGITMQGKYYHNMYRCSHDSTQTNWNKDPYFYREDSNKVYRYEWLIQIETLIYDFNLMVGDSILFDPYYECAYVTNVDSIMIAGVYRKRIQFENPNDVWIEGLGSLYSTFEPLIYYYMLGTLSELLCVNDSSGKLYQNPAYNSCWVDTLIVGTDEGIAMSSAMKIHPNPTSTHITIETPVESQLSILNLNGQELLMQTTTEPKTIINISTLPNGVYFVRVTGEKIVGVGKFIKQ